MFSGIPNLFAHAGYINFSWTARCEIVSQRICKTIKYIKKNKLLSCTPKYIGEKTKPSNSSKLYFTSNGSISE